MRSTRWFLLSVLPLFLVACGGSSPRSAPVGAGSSTKVGMAPNIASANVETVQSELTVAGTVSITGSATVKNVAYMYKVHRQCIVAPIGGGCISYLNVPTEVYICGSTQIGVVYPEANRTVTDLRCTPRLTALSGNVSTFNGLTINGTTKKLRLYYLFTAPGNGGFSPHLEGQTDSVTVSW